MNAAAKAKALGDTYPKSELHVAAVDYLETSNCRIGVACSAGADSVAALLLVYHHCPKLRDRLTVLHFNHRLRGSDSCDDEGFVRLMANDLGLEYRVGSWDDRDPAKTVSEESARKARQLFFDSFIADNEGAVIVTGHQKEDILETLMLRIARSSDMRGLSAPRPVSLFANGKVIVRPLLTIKKSDMVSRMTALQIDWREDESNREPNFDRNRLRNEVIPVWQEATQFDLHDAAAVVRNYLEDADELLERYIELAAFPIKFDNPSSLPSKEHPRAAVRRWLRLWVEAHGLSKALSRSTFEEILTAVVVGMGSQWSAGSGFIVLRQGEIEYRSGPVIETVPWDRMAVNPGETVLVSEGRTLSCARVDVSKELLSDLECGKYSEKYTVLIDVDAIENRPIFARPWKAGDRYRPLNALGTRKLQDMFVDRKIPKEERIHLPVVTTNDSVILWCPGLPVNHNCRVSKKTKEILQLTYT